MDGYGMDCNVMMWYGVAWWCEEPTDQNGTGVECDTRNPSNNGNGANTRTIQGLWNDVMWMMTYNNEGLWRKSSGMYKSACQQVFTYFFFFSVFFPFKLADKMEIV